MATQDKVMLLHQVEGTLKTRMFANLLEEAMEDINGHLTEYDIHHISTADGSDDLLETFIDAKRVEGRSDKTLTRYQYSIERFLRFAGVSANAITTNHVRAYISSEQQRGISDGTLEGLRQVLSSFFGWLEHEHLIIANPMTNVGVIKCQRKVRESLSDSDIERLKRKCTNPRDSAILLFLLATGCRIGEVTNLNKQDLDLNAMECVVLGKGNKQRTVYINDVTAMLIKEYLATRTDGNDALFVGRYGERLTPNGVRRMLKRLSERAKVSNVHPHRFRRTMITNAINRGMAIQDVAIVVGHDKIDTTMRYYASNKNRIRDSYRKYMT